MLFQRKIGDKCDKKLMDAASKTGIDAAKTASKGVVQKSVEAIIPLIGNKKSNKIISVGKTKNKEKEDKSSDSQEVYIPTDKI